MFHVPNQLGIKLFISPNCTSLSIKTKLLEMNNKGQLNILWFIYTLKVSGKCVRKQQKNFSNGDGYLRCKIQYVRFILTSQQVEIVLPFKTTFFVQVKFKFTFVLVCMSSFPMCSTSFLAPMYLSLCFSLCLSTPTTIPHHFCHSTQSL